MTTTTVSSGVTSSGLTVSKGSPLIVVSGGVADTVTVLSGGSATLSAGGVGSDVTVSKGGLLQGAGELQGSSSFDAGMVHGVTVSGALEVQSGGSASGVTIIGEVDVDHGATITGAVIKDGYLPISGAGVSARIESGGWEAILSGGRGSHDVVQSGGILTLDAGGVASGEIVQKGGLLGYGGVVSANLDLTSGPLAKKTVLGGVTISSGGRLHLNGATIRSGVTISLGSDAVETSLTVSKGAVVKGAGGLDGLSNKVAGSISGLTLQGTHVELLSGGTASNVKAISTQLNIDAGAKELGAVASASTLVVYGSASKTQIEAQSKEVLLSGGVGSGDTILASGQLYVSAGATAIKETVHSGGIVIFSGDLTGNFTEAAAVASNQTLAAASKTTVVDGITISSGGLIAVNGATVTSGATLTLASGANVSGLTVAKGGTLRGPGDLFGYTTAAGTVSGVTLSTSGVLVLQSGGVAGKVIVSGFTGAFTSLSILQVNSGAKAAGTVVTHGAAVTVFGSATGDMIESVGEEVVSSGGATSGSTVLSGGYSFVLSGGVATHTTVSSGGSETVEVGGTVSGLTVFAGGTLIDDGRVYVAGAGALAGTLSGTGAITETASGNLAIRGSGTAFGGYAVLSAGTIELAAAGAIGSGSVVFTEPSTSSQTLQIDAADAPAAGRTFTNVIYNFSESNDYIDLRSIAYVSGATAAMSGLSLVLTEGGETYGFQLAGNVGASFSVISDGHGGTQIDTGAAPAKVVAFAQAAAAFAPSTAAKAALMSGGVTSGLALAAHATASAGAGHI